MSSIEKRLLFVYVETSLHAGSGRGLGAVDLPIQRERLTDYPMVQASGLKGGLRAAVRATGLSTSDLELLFGPESAGDRASEHAGALVVGDARLLLFPVRSLGGVFAYTTSLDVLARLKRAADMLGVPADWKLPEIPQPASDEEKNRLASTAFVTGDALVTASKVVLEEFSFTPDKSHAGALSQIGSWIAQKALPATGYEYWAGALQSRLCLLAEEAFRDFARYATEVQTHVSLDTKTKTAADKALFTSEHLPADSLLYAPLIANPSRRRGDEIDGSAILEKFPGIKLQHIQLGGDETTGQGMVLLKVAGGAA